VVDYDIRGSKIKLQQLLFLFNCRDVASIKNVLDEACCVRVLPVNSLPILINVVDTDFTDLHRRYCPDH